MQNNLRQFYHNLLSKKEKKACWRGLSGSAIGFAIASFLKDDFSPLLIITPDFMGSMQLAQELRFFLEDDKRSIDIFPGWETLPYDHFSCNEDIVSERLLLLYQLGLGRESVLLIDAPTLMHRLAPKAYIEKGSFVMKKGDEVNIDLLRQKFVKHGYNLVSKVMEHGEFAVRGSIIDLFPMGSKVPYRIDFFDLVVDDIRIFDVDSQKSLESIDEIRLLPAKEFPLDDEGIERFSRSWVENFGSKKRESSVYQDVMEGRLHPGIEYYLPCFFENMASLFDYLAPNTVVIEIGDLRKVMDNFWNEEAMGRYEQLSCDITRPILEPCKVFIPPDEVFTTKSRFSQLLIESDKPNVKLDKNSISFCFKNKKIDEILVEKKAEKKLSDIKKFLEISADTKTLFIAETLGRRELLLANLRKVDLFPTMVDSWQEFVNSTDKINIVVANIEKGLFFDSPGNGGKSILIITEHELFTDETTYKSPELVSSQKIVSIIQDLTELQVNNPVVHIDYGIGRYLGLQKLLVSDHENEFLVLEYANQAKLYVPITSLHLISRYTGGNSLHTPLDNLGSTQWEKTKRQAKEKIWDVAAELLEICARRLNTKGFSFVKPENEYKRFIEGFPFILTVDQERAITEVISDMSSDRLMDRLICGDVGFGKTEVAMRAAFLAAYNNKQVVLLTPTTLLAQQHFTNFQERFASWPISVASLSRFANAREQKDVLEGLANGKIDIVIGTHKLLQKGVRFNDLGLLIIDEEHRFGVRQKEHIKKLVTNSHVIARTASRANNSSVIARTASVTSRTKQSSIDILSLTATPIPRTLNMAFAGIRDFSIITTPPAKRLMIKTFVSEYKPFLIKEAILREILRGGQVYFLHNDITSIDRMTNDLQSLIPEAKISVAHGQMRKKELEKIMRDFYHLRINVLVCTTIIESGLDIPTANTIIINRADKFGLAQLHQLRGRVGRSHHQAYAYLITPPRSVLSREAKRRLTAITAMKDLGAGFILATNDLEIRGAGELLGEKQSGVIEGVGFTLYMDMLKNAVNTLKKDDAKEANKVMPEIDLQVSALIPDKYIGYVNLRLVLYKRIAEVKNQHELDELQAEMIDRFGKLPDATINLFKLTSLKLKAYQLGMTKINFGVRKGVIEFGSNYDGDVKEVINLLEKYTSNYKFVGASSIEFTSGLNLSKIDFIDKLLTEWGSFVIMEPSSVIASEAK